MQKEIFSMHASNNLVLQVPSDTVNAFGLIVYGAANFICYGAIFILLCFISIHFIYNYVILEEWCYYFPVLLSIIC